MKTKTILFSLFAACTLACDAPAAEKKTAGPNGGRILPGLEPRAEFFVLPDRKIQITFLGSDGKAIDPAAQSVTVTTGERAAPTTMTFTKSGKALVSNVALPAGNALPAVVQIKPAPDAKAVTARFYVDLSVCGECKHAEYACICDH